MHSPNNSAQEQTKFYNLPIISHCFVFVMGFLMATLLMWNHVTTVPMITKSLTPQEWYLSMIAPVDISDSLVEEKTLLARAHNFSQKEQFIFHEQTDDTVETSLEGRELYVSYIHHICNKEEYQAVDPYIIIAMIETESRFQPDVSNGNHVGLAQLSTKYFAPRMEKFGIKDIWNPYDNLLMGIDFINELLVDYADGDTPLALMMYNMSWSKAKSLHRQGQMSTYARTIIERAEELREEDALCQE